MRNYSQEVQEQIKNFFSACNEMIEGKFILSDLKIQKILKCIAESQVLYDLITKCLINFSFADEIKKAKTSNRVNGGYFNMPQEEHKIIALVFCLFLEVDNKRINLQKFITENFYNPDGYNISYSNFSLVMLVPFKNAIMNLLGCDENGNLIDTDDDYLKENQITMDEVINQNNEEKQNAKINIGFANLHLALTELVNAIKVNSKLKINQKEELLIVSNAIADCIKNKNLKLISALLIAFEYALKNNRAIRPYYNNLLNVFIEMV